MKISSSGLPLSKIYILMAFSCYSFNISRLHKNIISGLLIYFWLCVTVVVLTAFRSFFFVWICTTVHLSITFFKNIMKNCNFNACFEGSQNPLKVWNTKFLKNISTKGLIRCPKGVKVLIRWKSFPLKVW